MTEITERSPGTLVTALTCRCPRCGRAPLFSGLLKVVSHCRSCGLELTRYDTGDGPVALVILVIGFIVVPAAVTVEMRYEPPFWVHAALWTPLTIAGSIGLLRIMKAWLVGQQFRHLPPTD